MDIIEELRKQFEQNKHFKVKLEPETVIGELDINHKCLICLDIVWDALSCKECEMSFCKFCMDIRLKTDASCPNC